MAKGRLIVRALKSDVRIWKQLNDMSCRYFLATIPHFESDGTIPGELNELRYECFPIAEISDDDLKSCIETWQTTNPPLLVKKGSRLFSPDFKPCNSGLDFTHAERQRRYRDKASRDGSDGGDAVTPKRSEVKRSEVKKRNNIFVKPSLDEVRDFCIERENGIDPIAFYAYYEANGWKVGKNPMKSWQAAVVTWEKNRR